MTKITHVTSVHNRFDNRIFRKQCVDLAATGFDVTLLVADGYGDEQRDGVEIRDCSLSVPRNRFFRMFVTSPYMAIAALRMKTTNYHIHDPELLFFFIFFSAFFKKKKLVFDMHENLSEQVKAKMWIPAIFRLPLAIVIRWYEAILFRHVPVIFAESSYSKFFPEAKKSEIVMNFPKSHWMDVSQAQAAKTAPSTIGYIGRIGTDRGVGTLLTSVAAINKSGRTLRLALIGVIPEDLCENDDLHYLKELGMLDAHGFVENHRAVELVRSWDIGFSVLNALPNFVESYPTKIFEYMAAGVPVIASNFPLYESLIKETGGGICIEPGRVDLLIQAITGILDNWDQYKPSLDADRYCWSGQFSRLVEFYSEVL
jgi:glycosyltransferase involved in cell wall biosynthesis